MSVQNRELSRRWFQEIWNERRAETIEELLTPESVGHLEGGEMTGAEPFKQFHSSFLEAFPDIQVDIEETIADGDSVVVRWCANATHDGDGLGLRATHQQVCFRGMTWIRFKDGKMIEGWDSWSPKALMQQLRDGPDDQPDQTINQRHELAARLRTVRLELFGEHGAPEMARQLDVPVRSYFNYESGVAIPGEIMLRILEVTGARPAWLLHGEKPIFEGGPVDKAAG